jgi:hypothetical protein
VADFGQHILEDVSRFVNGFNQSDDMCLVCFGRVEEGSERSHHRLDPTRSGTKGTAPSQPVSTNEQLPSAPVGS